MCPDLCDQFLDLSDGLNRVLNLARVVRLTVKHPDGENDHALAELGFRIEADLERTMAKLGEIIESATSENRLNEVAV